ncbi:MAG: LacI family DNA-binding transcriptional regulator [Trueperaceae bacterium]|jgi:DNA-binding LacI/PurR family transcriptional regulator
MSTIRDIARAAGVSVSTASLALNGDARVRPATRDRVLAAAEELRYHPSRTAKSLSSGRTWSLHLMNPERDAGLSSSFFTKFVRGVHDVVAAHDFILALTVLDDEREASDLLKKLTLERWTDGVILMNVSEEDTLVGQLVKLEFPHVLLGHSSLPGVTSVDSDNFAVAFDATSHLIEKGHTPIVFLNGSARHTFVQERSRGFMAAHAAANLAPPTQDMVQETASADKARAVTKELIRSGQPLGGILATSDETAIGALRALRDSGKRVPDDVAVVGINNDDLADYTDPRLTSVELNAAELGRVAAELLIGSIARHPPERRLVPHHLVSRDSG